MAQELKLKALNAEMAVKQFRSGVWARDEYSFVNARSMLPDTSLLNVSIYEFDSNYHLLTITAAKRAVFVGDGRWRLEQAAQTYFDGHGTSVNIADNMEWLSSITPDLLNVLVAPPEQMSASSLYQYIEYLRDNKQKTVRYEIAMWNKLMYPVAVLVMLLLALPFAAYNRRAGGVSDKVFAGIVLGLSFHFIGRLFANLGALNGWQPMLSATAMTWLFLLLAGSMLWWTERR
jgi:lipopolysaccharide export system permease protein